jgi:hypothetical protein
MSIFLGCLAVTAIGVLVVVIVAVGITAIKRSQGEARHLGVTERRHDEYRVDLS